MIILDLVAKSLRYRRLRPLGVLLILASFAMPTVAQMRFDRLFTDAEAAGQGVGAIRVIVQDDHGFIWLGGENGLARYDGVRLKRYVNNPRVAGTLTSSYVRDIKIDHDGVMWVATDLGLCRYNPRTDDFTAFLAGEGERNISHNVVMSLALDTGNNLYLGTANGLNVFNAARSEFRRYYPQPSQMGDTGANTIQDVFIDNQSQVWLGTGELGLARFNLEDDQYELFQHDQNDPNSITSDSVLDIEQDHTGQLWIATYGGGVSRMNIAAGTFHSYRHDPADPSSIGSNAVWDIFQDSEGVIWLATDPGGLARYDEAHDRFSHHRHSPYNRDSISSNVVRTVFEDRQRDLWVGTFPSGVNFYSRAVRKFTNYMHKPDDAQSLSHSAVLSFLQDREGLVWIGTEGGLDSFDPLTKTFTRHNLQPGAQGGLRANAVLSLEEDYNGDLWVGTWSGGLHRYNKDTGVFHNYFPDKNDPSSINSAFVWQIMRDSQNNLWVATETGGLNRYDRSTDSFTALVHDPLDETTISGNFVWAVLEDRVGDIWVGTINGLDRFDQKTQRFVRYTENSTDPEAFNSIIRIRSLAEDQRGRIWIGTQDNGAFVYNPLTDRFIRLDQTRGLPSPYVPSLVEDGLGNMWMTTGNGVARVNVDTLEVTAYRKGHGLVGNNFNRDATLKDRDGNLYFGGADGFSVVDPSTLEESSEQFPVLITGFRIFNRPVPIGEPGSPLQSSVLTTQTITLNHSHAMFSFDFAALSYRFASRNQYAYKLEGFDKDWNSVGTDNTATYTNIGAGTYVFKVKAANGEGVWSNEIATKRVVVLPPPWRTWWAYLTYGLIAILFGATVVRAKMKKMEYDNQKALNTELLRVNKIKDTFLANTSHELRTPLNGIIGIAESMADSPTIRASDDLFHRLNLIVFSGKRLSTLINDILDYSKLSESKLELFCKPVNLKVLIDDVFQLLGPLSEAKQIELENSVDESQAPVYADENRLQQILINLIGNGIKYADAGVVRVYCRQYSRDVEVVVEDSGAGIAADQYENVFKAFTQIENSDSRRHGGTGLGLSVSKQLVELHGGRIWVESQLGIGSKFIFTLNFATLAAADIAPSNAEAKPLAPSATLPARTRKSRRPAMASVDDLDLQPAPVNAPEFRILIVDDDPVNRLVLSGILALHSYQVIEASGGQQAVDLVASGVEVDLVILDVMMPEFNGYDTCKAIRLHRPLHELPVIFLTAKKVDQDIAKAFASGGTEILAKPVSKYELLPRVGNQLKLLERHREHG